MIVTTLWFIDGIDEEVQQKRLLCFFYLLRCQMFLIIFRLNNNFELVERVSLADIVFEGQQLEVTEIHVSFCK